MNNTSGAYSLFDSANCVIYNERVLNSTKFGNKLNLIHETWSRKFAAYRKPYCSKKKYHTTCLPSMQPWTGESTHLLIQAPPFSADKSHKKKHDLCKRSTFYFLYKKLMHNCWNTSHKQCVQPQRDHRNFMVIKIKTMWAKISIWHPTQGLQMNTFPHWRHLEQSGRSEVTDSWFQFFVLISQGGTPNGVPRDKRSLTSHNKATRGHNNNTCCYMHLYYVSDKKNIWRSIVTTDCRRIDLHTCRFQLMANQSCERHKYIFWYNTKTSPLWYVL